MDARHIPTGLNLFRGDLRRGMVVSVDTCLGTSVCSWQDCQPAGGDDIRLVLEPSIVMASSQDGRTYLRAAPLDEVIRVEINRGSSNPVAWVRDQNGIWQRFYPGNW